MRIVEAATVAANVTQEAQHGAVPMETPTADMFPELSSEAPSRSRAWPGDHTPAFPINGPSAAVPMSLGTAGGAPVREVQPLSALPGKDISECVAWEGDIRVSCLGRTHLSALSG